MDTLSQKSSIQYIFDFGSYAKKLMFLLDYNDWSPSKWTT